MADRIGMLAARNEFESGGGAPVQSKAPEKFFGRAPPLFWL